MGLVHLYYGYGKGKTTAAQGLAMRMAGSGGSVLMFQFLKDNSSSERLALKESIDIMAGRENEKFSNEMTDAERLEAGEYYSQKLRDVMGKSDSYDMLVLDEVIAAVSCGFVDEDELIELINENREKTEIVLTGHEPSQRVIDCCDYVTELRKVKHPYDSGIQARKGIEY